MKQKIIILVALLLAGAAAFVGYQYTQHKQEQERLRSPQYALTQLEKALVTKNLDLFKQHADINRISASIVEQMMTEKEEAEEASMADKLTTSITGKLASYIKPELTHSVSAQIVTFIETGRPQQEGDLSSLYTSTPLVTKIWNELGGDALKVTQVTLLPSSEESQLKQANVEIAATGTNYKDTLKITLEKTDTTWRMIAIDGLVPALEKAKHERITRIEAQNAEAQKAMDAALSISNIQKAQTESKFSMGKALLIRAAFENTGEKDITSFHAQISFLNETGALLKTVSVKDSDLILKGDTSEKSWQMMINPISPAEAELYNTNMNAISTEYQITDITFIDETKLSLQKVE